MKLEITQEVDQKLCSRKDVRGKLTFEKQTPSNAEVKSALAQSLKVDAELVVVKKIRTSQGLRLAQVRAFAYENKQELERFEPKKRKKRTKKKKK